MRCAAGRIPGCYELFSDVHEDSRGTLVKVYQRSVFEKLGLETAFLEEFHTVSKKGVLRGLHIQGPPVEQNKLVYCMRGTVFDALLDLRVGSPTYGGHEIFELSAEAGNAVYVPAGVAHGFYVLSAEALMVYKVSTEHDPARYGGILWSSAGIPWPDNRPILSEKDTGLTRFDEFKSPFAFKGIRKAA